MDSKMTLEKAKKAAHQKEAVKHQHKQLQGGQEGYVLVGISKRRHGAGDVRRGHYSGNHTTPDQLVTPQEPAKESIDGTPYPYSEYSNCEYDLIMSNYISSLKPLLLFRIEVSTHWISAQLKNDTCPQVKQQRTFCIRVFHEDFSHCYNW